jgi:anti-sigma regulatory factor (Ser/Thr protein kinase)
MERLKTAVGETVMNAIEHGNQYRDDLDVRVEVATRPNAVTVRVTDHGGEKEIPLAEVPDIEAKLSGEQSPRGWGLFLVGELVDEMNTTTADGLHTIELVMKREGGR